MAYELRGTSVTPFEELDFIGTTSEAKIVEVFLVSVFHNIFDPLFVSGIIAAAGESWSRVYLTGSGIAYVGLTAYGFAIDENSNFNFPPVNTADNFLHMGLAIGLLGAGLISLAASRRREHATV